MFATLKGYGIVLFDKDTYKLCVGIVNQIVDGYVQVGQVTDMNNHRMSDKTYKQGSDGQLVWNELDFKKNKRHCVKEVMEYLKSVISKDADYIQSQIKKFGPTIMYR